MLADLLRGALAGTAATWLMDLVTTALLQGQAAEVTAREEAARPNGKHAVENFVDRLQAELSLTLDERQRAIAVQVVHYGLGAAPGALYALLRRRLPLVGAGRGLLYGVALWAVNDEYLNTALGLAGPPDAYPLETHWRGLVGHAVLGVATDVGVDLLRG